MPITDNIPALDWEGIRSGLVELLSCELDAGNVGQWLDRWTRLSAELAEYGRLAQLAGMLDTRDAAAQQRFRDFVDRIEPQARSLEQELGSRLLESGLEPDGMGVSLRRMRAEVSLFREANLPLKARIAALGMEYRAICGDWSVEWDGKRIPIAGTRSLLEGHERGQRELAWRRASGRRLQDREHISALWAELVDLRCQLAENAGQESYIDYAWLELGRHDYSPAAARHFHHCVQGVVVPALQRRQAVRSSELSVDRVRPWDLTCDSLGRAPLRPFDNPAQLEEGVANVLAALDPRFGAWFSDMRGRGLLDLGSREGKAPGGYMDVLPGRGQPFIMLNAVGMAIDVRILIHECGHAFHAYQTLGLPWLQQRELTMDCSELASMAMELLAAPYLGREHGGFYAPAEQARDFRGQLEYIISSWVMFASVDSLEHWIHANPGEARNADRVSARWLEIQRAFHPYLDISGLEEETAWSWQRLQHLFLYPFYYLDYGLAQLGAVQIWRNSLQDEKRALAQYMDCLALGGTATLPQVFETAGARFSIDNEIFRELVGLVEDRLCSGVV